MGRSRGRISLATIPSPTKKVFNNILMAAWGKRNL
jgi:hypothetical protein